MKSNSKVLAYLTLGKVPLFGWQMAILLLYLLGLLGSQDRSLLIGRSLTLEARTGVPSLGEGGPPADTAGCVSSPGRRGMELVVPEALSDPAVL